MKDTLLATYKDTVLNVYTQDFLKSDEYEYVVCFKELEKEYVENGVLHIGYDELFKIDLLKYPIPPIRKTRKLLSYEYGLSILKDVNYGSLAITDEVPYQISLTHFIVNDRIYFHCGYTGHKLTGLNKLACFNVVKDLGINESANTQNHESVIVYGYLKEVTENKKALLNAFMERYTPTHVKEITEPMINNTMVFELTI